MTHFSDFGLSDALNISLEKMGYAAPTPIQQQAIPFALEGRDILGSAQTGTGKTAAFSIPLVEAILRNEQGSALVLTPTRELAKQVLDVITQLLGPKTPIKTAFIIGGESMAKQFSQLKARPRIIVGTPGRVNDHLERGTLRLNDANFLVLDETDRMLDMGFGIQLDKIMKFMPKQRQTLMFSATMPKEIIGLSGKYLTNPQRVAVGATNVVAKNIEQEVIRIQQERKYDELVSQLTARDGSVIVFIKTKHAADRIAKNLRRDGFESDALHGDLRQGKRTSVMNSFRNKKFRILVATDIAARGLDVPHIEHVINFDLPQVAEDYIHRMGRTARAGAKGSALCFISPQEGRQWSAIERLLNPDAAQNNEPRGGFGGKSRSNGQGRPASKKFGSKFRPDSRDGRPSEGRSEYRGNSEGRPARSEGGRSEGRSNDFRNSKPRSAEGRSEGFRSDNRGDEGRPARSSEGRSEYRGNSENRAPRNNDDNRGNNFQSNEGRKIDAERKAFGTPRSASFRDAKPRPQGDRPFGNRAEGGRSEGNRSENRGNDFRNSKPRSAEGRSEGRSSEGRSEFRGNSRDGEKRGNGEARAPRKAEGGNESRGNSFHSKEGRPSEGRKDAPRGGKPAGKPSWSGKPKSKTAGGDKPFAKKPRTTRSAA